MTPMVPIRAKSLTRNLIFKLAITSALIVCCPPKSKDQAPMRSDTQHATAPPVPSLEGPPGTSEFPGTIWQEVTDQQKVVQNYWHALRIYLVCLVSRFPDYAGEADDILQDFIMKKILQPGWLELAKPDKGRFRDFLKSS